MAQQGGGKKGAKGSVPPPKATGAKKPLPPALAARVWKPGQSGNPRGIQGTQYLECLQLARQASPEAMRKMIALMNSTDERVALMAQDKVLERAWGKVKEIDPNEGKAARPDLSALDGRQIRALKDIMRTLAESAAQTPEPQDGEGIVIEGEAREVE